MTETPLTVRDLNRYLTELLSPALFKDYCPNGLQIEASKEVRKVAFGVSANQRLIDQATAWGADALVVHHGFFWKGEPAPLVGWKGRRIAALFRSGCSLFGYHLPLDAHDEYGNNAVLLRALGLSPSESFADSLGKIAVLDAPVGRKEFVAHAETIVGQRAVSFLHGPEEIRRVAVITGGAASYFEQAIDAGADLFITGEPSEQSQGYAEELGGNFIALGHHATERFGVRALGQHLASHFGVETRFIDVANPV